MNEWQNELNKIINKFMTTSTDIFVIFSNLYQNNYVVPKKELLPLKEAQVRYLCYQIEYNPEILFDLARYSLEDIGSQLGYDLSDYYYIINLLFQRNSISQKISDMEDHNKNNFLHLMIINSNFFTMKFFLRSMSCAPKIFNHRNILNMSPFELSLNIKDLDVIRLIATHDFFCLDKSLINYEHYDNLDINTKEYINSLIHVKNKFTYNEAIAEILKPTQILNLYKDDNFDQLLDNKENIKNIILEKYPFISKYRIQNKIKIEKIN